MSEKTIYQKWQAVMDETGAIEKDTEVGYGHNKYRAVGEAAVLNMVKPLLKKYKLIVFPVDIVANEIVDIIPTSRGESPRAITQLIVTWQVVDTETGEKMEMKSIGNGADPQDKGSGKAMTYAYKVLFQKSLMLFSGEDTDNTHSDQITQENELDKSKTINSGQASILVKLIAKMPDNRQTAFYDHYKISDINELPEYEYGKALKYLQKVIKDD